MAGYEKFTLKSFQEKLKSGGYDSLKGVNRAIGRMSTWSPKDRTKARELALAHFGDAPAPTKGPKKVAPKKAAGKKAVAKSPAPKKVVKTRAAKTPPTPKIPKGSAPAPRGAADPIEQANRRVVTIRSTLESMDLAKRLGAPSEDVANGAKQAQAALTRVIDDLGASVSSLLGAGSTEPERRGASAFEASVRATIAAGGNGLPPTPVVQAPSDPRTMPHVPTES